MKFGGSSALGLLAEEEEEYCEEEMAALVGRADGPGELAGLVRDEFVEMAHRFEAQMILRGAPHPPPLPDLAPATPSPLPASAPFAPAAPDGGGRRLEVTTALQLHTRICKGPEGTIHLLLPGVEKEEFEVAGRSISDTTSIRPRRANPRPVAPPRAFTRIDTHSHKTQYQQIVIPSPAPPLR